MVKYFTCKDCNKLFSNHYDAKKHQEHHNTHIIEVKWTNHHVEN